MLKSPTIFAELPAELKLHIFDYAQNPQPKRLLRDIENFSYTWKILKAEYYRIWVEVWEETAEDAHLWIHNDIIGYVNEQPTQDMFTPRFFNYWERLFSIKNRDDVLRLNARLLTTPLTAVESVSRNMWALLLPHERCSFLSLYLGEP